MAIGASVRTRPRVPIESEPRRPSTSSQELLERVAAELAPNDPRLAEWFDRYRRTHAARLAMDLEILQRCAAPHAEILEYGAVPLLLTSALAELGFRVKALDLAPERFAASIERLGLDVRSCDVETERVPFESESFDLVLFNELFEHLRIDPIFTLSEVRRILKPEGLLLLSTPNLRSFRGLRHLWMDHRGHASSGGVYEQYEKLSTLGHMGHVREYTAREVAEFLSRIGLRPERVVFRGGHGVGMVGMAERLLPTLRPSFTVMARKDERSEVAAAGVVEAAGRDEI